MPQRKFDAGSGYRYGFNGKENDKDISEGGQDYGMRIYDARVGRFLSVDPLTHSFSFYSPYQYAGNTPIQAIDLDGLEEYIVTTELYKNGKIKSIMIEFTKDKANNNVNVHFKEVIGKNPDGSNELGEYLTGNKVLRIVKYGNGNSKLGTMNDELSKEELAVVRRHTHNHYPIKPENDAWIIRIQNTLYWSETERNTDIMQDKIAIQDFPLLVNLEQKIGTGGIYIGGTTTLGGADLNGKSPVKNGQIEWLSSEGKQMKSLISDIKEDGGIKSISISISLNISNCTDSEYNIFKAGVETAGTLLKSEFVKSGVEPKNITVRIQALRDKQNTAKGVEITLTR